MNKETLRMQMLSGVITEGEYKVKLEKSKKDSLNEHYVAGGIVGIGAINQIPSRAKADYEDAFEHFLGQKYNLNEMEKEVEENIHNTAQMGGILGGRNFSAEAEEDKKAAFEIEDLIQSGESKEEAIKKISNKYRLQPSYLSRKYNLYVLKGKKEVEEAMVNPNISDRVSYLVRVLNRVWNMGKGNNSIDFEDMAKSIVDDMFDDLEEGKKEKLNEGNLDGLYMELKNVLFPYYTGLTGKERVDMIDDVIKELNSYILILQDEKKAKQ